MDDRLSTRQPQISQGQLRHIGTNNETGRFTNINFNKVLLAMEKQ